ncbi:MAG: hypothetical protein P4L28_05455 [Paludibacteraceae bacterium]|nr:hypothetical protein [Paludibacteraceae bacterium]
MNDIKQLLETYPKRKTPKAKYNKPNSIKLFEREYDNWYYKGKDVPYKVKSSFRDDKANELTKLIVAYCKVHGYFAARVNSTGTYSAKLGKYIHSGARAGMADVTAVINGKHVSIEIKAGHDRPRPEQLKVQNEVEAAGGRYLFVHSFDDFLSKL